jgi:hypothetical protein
VTTPTEAMQDWLALEHEAVWLYPVIGARFPQDERATTSFSDHRLTRDRLLARLHATGAAPATPHLAYGKPPASRKAAVAAAKDMESRISAACLALTGVTEGAPRTFAVEELRRAALAALVWGAEPQAFPGLD